MERRFVVFVPWLVACFAEPPLAPDDEAAPESSSSTSGDVDGSTAGGQTSDPPSTTSSSSADAEPSSSSGVWSSSSSESGSASEAETAVNGDPTPYWDCWPGVAMDLCPKEGAPYGCLRSEDPELEEEDFPSACSPGCDPIDHSCPPTAGGREAICLSEIAVGTGGYCVLQCEGAGDCPDGMECLPVLQLDDGAGGHPTLCLWS